MEIFKSLSSAESWESEEDCPPLASEDSDIGDHRELEFLAAEQTKRRHIICSLVHSENNYLASLDRLVGEYKLEQILASHLQFRGALTEAVQEEKIGDVFVSCFSKSKVLEVYSDFINNFNQAMELAKSESKRKSAFADFLKVKQITASDRLNFFGLMVKPAATRPAEGDAPWSP